MEWVMATKIALQSLFDKKIRNLLIALILGVVIFLFSFLMIPTLIFSLPQMAFSSETEAKDMTNKYIDILVEYKKKIHDDVRSAKKEYINQGKTISQIKINYPSLSVVISYENVLNKDKYKKDKIQALNLSKEQIFKFLDGCMSYMVEGETLVAKVKSAEEISKIFKSEEDRNMFILVYETMKKTDLDSSVPDVPFSDFEYLEGGIQLPYLAQYDSRWAYEPYGDSTVKESGCAITRLCMVIHGLLPDTNILPPELALWSANNGHYVSGAGTAWSFFGAVANKYNLNMKNLSRNNPQEILDELAQGHPVVVSMSPGHFTTGGHLMVLRGIDKDGKILVSDPASADRSNKSWDFSLILAESSVLSPSCFWAYSTK